MADHRPRARIRPGALLLADLCMFLRVGKGLGQTHPPTAQCYQETDGQSEEKSNLPLFEIALVLARLDHVARFIVNVNYAIM